LPLDADWLELQNIVFRNVKKSLPLPKIHIANGFFFLERNGAKPNSRYFK
jgi:hypothetical protein